MISFSLICRRGHEFDAWFRNGAAFDEQRERGAVACPVCGSKKVEKGLMAPNISSKSNRSEAKEATAPAVYSAPADPQVAELAEKVRALRKHIESTAEYVGDRFPEEARKIHYEETEKRGIYGEASLEDARGLIDEGIDLLPVPVLPEEHN